MSAAPDALSALPPTPSSFSSGTGFSPASWICSSFSSPASSSVTPQYGLPKRKPSQPPGLTSSRILSSKSDHSSGVIPTRSHGLSAFSLVSGSTPWVGIGAVLELLAVGLAVAVGVGLARVAAERELLAVGQAVAVDVGDVRDRVVGVGQAVAVGVDVARVGAAGALVGVADPVAVAVGAAGARRGRAAAVVAHVVCAILQTPDLSPAATLAPTSDATTAATITATSSSTPRYSAAVWPRCSRTIVSKVRARRAPCPEAQDSTFGGPEVLCRTWDLVRRWCGAGSNREADRRVLRPGLMPTDDAQLLARISSDATGEALRALYRTYAGELYGFALNALGDRGTAEEVVQEVFTRAWRHAEAYDPTRGSVRTWLYQIARHAIIDSRRRAAVRPALALHEPRDEQDPEGLSIERAMLGWQVAGALDKLTPEHRQVIRLAHVQGLAVREIAERLGLPEGTVKSRTWYALRSLRLVLEEMGVRA